MSVTVVVGGQYGSEAKAKAVVRHAQQGDKPVTGIRCGGPNAGHTVHFQFSDFPKMAANAKYVLRLVPSTVAVPNAKLIICAGAMIDVDLLQKEIEEIEAMGVPVRGRLFVDANCVMVSPDLIKEEKEARLGEGIGSTQTGTGSTAAARAMRMAMRIGDIPRSRLEFWPVDTFPLIHESIANRENVIVEGTQGFGLSLYHSGHYPFCTSKDTTASAFIAEAGISPRDVTDIIMVVRTYPIRVGGNSGPMKDEISWPIIKDRCGSPMDLIEMTSVTKKVRRVGEWDWDLFHRAVAANKPTQLAVHGLDYLHWTNRGARSVEGLRQADRNWITQLEVSCGIPVTMAFTGPLQDDIITMDKSGQGWGYRQ